jgi:hypothetical protein
VAVGAAVALWVTRQEKGILTQLQHARGMCTILQ